MQNRRDRQAETVLPRVRRLRPRRVARALVAAGGIGFDRPRTKRADKIKSLVARGLVVL